MNPTTGSDTFTLKGFIDMLVILQGGAKKTPFSKNPMNGG